MSPNLSERSIQTIIANLSLAAIGIGVLVFRPDTSVLSSLVPAFLAINGYEVFRQSENRKET
jgi:hypothetical protein